MTQTPLSVKRVRLETIEVVSPCPLKWDSLSRALHTLRGPEPRDWSQLDVRWDVPEIRVRAAAGD